MSHSSPVPLFTLPLFTLEQLDAARLTRSLVRRLERLGHHVTLQPQEPAA
jgi:hypothetical protein